MKEDPMSKRILILLVAFVFAFSGSSIAGVVELSDDAMDGIHAGDWVIVQDSDGNESVEDVYTNNNTLWLLEESQKDVKAVSNANVIDSAVAVQTNIARVAGDPTANVAVSQSNEANLTNYRPADSATTTSRSSTLEGSVSSTYSQSNSAEAMGMNMQSGQSASSSAAASAAESLAYNETLDIAGSSAGSDKTIDKNGLGGGSFASALVVDYDKVIAASKTAASASASESSATAASAMQCVKESSSVSGSETETLSASESETVTTTRNAKGANNHILLDATSQQTMQVVSNLNAVASGAAVQNNIASNVGVGGSITHVNSATVSSGF
jgi:hypothetical protein